LDQSGAAIEGRQKRRLDPPAYNNIREEQFITITKEPGRERKRQRRQTFHAVYKRGGGQTGSRG